MMKMRFSRPEVEIAYQVSGSGPALLLMAATAFPGSLWWHFELEDLAQDFQVIVFDQRGTGETTVTSNDFSTATLASDAIALLDHLGIEKAHIFGHSNGGRVAQYIAIHHPERAQSLVLASSGGTHKSRGVPIEMCLKLVTDGYFKYSRDHAIGTGCLSVLPEEHERAKRFLQDFLGSLVPLEIFLRFVVARQETDTFSGIAAYSKPVLVLVGENEGKMPGDNHMEFATKLHIKLLNVQLHVIESQGHFYPFLQPHKIHRLIRKFLALNFK